MIHLTVLSHSAKLPALTALAFIFLVMNIVATDNAVIGSSRSSHEGESYWTLAKSMPTARGEFGAVLLKDKIYALGGVDYGSTVDKKDVVEVYDIDQNRWSNDVKPMPVALDHFASAEYGGKIYVVGGFVEKKIPTDKVFIYDPQKNEWQEGKSLPSARGALKAQFISGILYAVGGLNSSEVPVNTNYAYDPNTNTWTTKAPMFTSRQHMASAVIDGKLYVMGGRILGDGVPSEDISQTLTNFNRVETYDPKTDSWTQVQPMLTKRSGFTAASANGQIFVFGGQDVIGISDTVEKYDPAMNRWTFDKPMSSERFASSAVAFDGRIYVLGGQVIDNSDLIASSLNEVFHSGIRK